MPLSIPFNQRSNHRTCRASSPAPMADEATPNDRSPWYSSNCPWAHGPTISFWKRRVGDTLPPGRVPLKFSVALGHHGSYQPPRLQTGRSTSVTRAIRSWGRLVETYPFSQVSYSGGTSWMNGSPALSGTAAHVALMSFSATTAWQITSPTFSPLAARRSSVSIL